MFGVKTKPIIEKKENLSITAGDAQKIYPNGVPYQRIKKTIMMCELDKQSVDCKNALRELNIEVID